MAWLGAMCLLCPPTPLLRRMSETPTTTCIAIRFQFVWCPCALRKGRYCQYSSHLTSIAVCLPFVLQYASHLYRSSFGRILVVVIASMFPVYLSGLEDSLTCRPTQKHLHSSMGHTPKGAYSSRGRPRHLLESPLLRTPFENPSQNPF